MFKKATAPQSQIKKHCYFCSQNIQYADYKDTDSLKRFLSTQFKILSPRRTGTCTSHQRLLAQAIKRARYMAILPYTNK